MILLVRISSSSLPLGPLTLIPSLVAAICCFVTQTPPDTQQCRGLTMVAGSQQHLTVLPQGCDSVSHHFVLPCSPSLHRQKSKPLTFRSVRLRNLQFHQGGQHKKAAAESQADCLPLPGKWCYDSEKGGSRFMWNV